jgi:hypothetical protein
LFVDCALGAAAAVTNLATSVTGFMNVPSTKGPITLSASSAFTYAAVLCSKPTSRKCLKQRDRVRRSLLESD